MNNSKTWEEIYAESGFGNRYASSYLVSLFHARMKPILTKTKELSEINVLDFGCALGANSRIFSDLNMNTYGVDVSDVAIRKLWERNIGDQEHFKAHNVLESDALLADIFGVKFDLIVASEVMYYFTNKERRKVVENFFSSSSGGGVLYASMHSRNYSFYGGDEKQERDADGMICMGRSGSIENPLRVNIPEDEKEVEEMFRPYTKVDILTTNNKYWSDREMVEYHLIAQKP